MKILEINIESTWRGGERQTIYDLLGYNMHGHETVLLCKKDKPLSRYAKREGIKMLQVQWPFWGILKCMFTKARDFDVIHVQSFSALNLVLRTKWFHQKPVVYTDRLDFIAKGKKLPSNLQTIDKIIAVSPAIQKKLEEQKDLNVEHITEVARAQLLDKSRAGSIVKKYAGGKKIIATVAATTPNKDPLTMIKAIAKLAAMRNDFVFLHYGFGELDASLAQWIKEYKLEKVYIQMGFIKHVEDFFSMMDVFVMSSEEEGLCSSVLDAFIYKIPVASTNAGGLKDVVEGFGLVSKVKDFEALAENIGKLLDDENLRNELIEKAYNKAITEHSIEKVSKQYLNLFARLIHK